MNSPRERLLRKMSKTCNCDQPRYQTCECSHCHSSFQRPLGKIEKYEFCDIHRNLLGAVCTFGLKAPPLLCESCEEQGFHYQQVRKNEFKLAVYAPGEERDSGIF